MFACERFNQYVYARTVNVESDHKPLEAITKKNMVNISRRLQQMLLRLQRYDFQIRYRRGSELYIEDTLSRAYLNEVEQAPEQSKF